MLLGPATQLVNRAAVSDFEDRRGTINIGGEKK